MGHTVSGKYKRIELSCLFFRVATVKLAYNYRLAEGCLIVHD